MTTGRWGGDGAGGKCGDSQMCPVRSTLTGTDDPDLFYVL